MLPSPTRPLAILYVAKRDSYTRSKLRVVLFSYWLQLLSLRTTFDKSIWRSPFGYLLNYHIIIYRVDDLLLATMYSLPPSLNVSHNIITRTGEGGIPCGDHVNCFVYGYFTSLKDEWNITTQNNEHDLHRGSPTHLFLFLCRTIDVISSCGIVPVLRDLHQRSRSK